MGIKDEVTEVAAEVVEKGVEAGSHLAGEALDCVCTGTKAVLEGAGQVVGKVLSTLVHVFGPKD